MVSKHTHNIHNTHMHIDQTKILLVHQKCGIMLALLNLQFFSIALCKVIALNLMCFTFVNSSLLLFPIVYYSYNFFMFSEAIAKSFSYICHKLNHQLMHKHNAKLEQLYIRKDNFCHREILRAVTKWEALEKSPLLLSQFWKINNFGGTNIIFTDYTTHS